jgi:ribosome-associated protein
MSKSSKALSIKKLETIAVDALEDIKGRDIIVVNTTNVSQMFERLVLASGDSNRQVRSLARNVADKVREAGGEVLSVEGEEMGEWVLVDLGPVVVHIMQPAVRLHFDLEELWGAGKPAGVAAKKAAARPKKNAAEKTLEKNQASAESEKKPATKKVPAKKTAAKQAATKKPAAKKTAA